MKGRSSTTVLGFPFFAQRSGNPMLAQQKFWERCFAKEEEARGVAKWGFGWASGDEGPVGGGASRIQLRLV